MLTELYGKAGQVCQAAKQGQIRCPLIIRPTSEDVITGEIFQTLRCLNPRWWLPDFLNQALGANRFRQQVYRQLKIELWQNQPAYPRELLPWDEGSTQVDVVITWENPRTTVFVEMKYGSALSPQTANSPAGQDYPADQLLRNIRVGLWRAGWFRRGGLFVDHPRDFVQVLLTPEAGHPLVAKYQDSDTLRASIPYSERLERLPTAPFVGEQSYSGLIGILQHNERWLSRSERAQVGQLVDFLRLKLAAVPKPTLAYRQPELTSREGSTATPMT